MKNKYNTQKTWVEKILNQHGEISRNFCLQNYVTRLGAIIHELNREGWEITGRYRKNGTGKDFVYFSDKSPYKKVVRTVRGVGTQIVSYEK